MSSVTKDLAVSTSCGQRRGSSFPRGAGRGGQVTVMGRRERSRVGFEVLPGGQADLVKVLSLSSSETSGRLLCWCGRRGRVSAETRSCILNPVRPMLPWFLQGGKVNPEIQNKYAHGERKV